MAAAGGGAGATGGSGLSKPATRSGTDATVAGVTMKGLTAFAVLVVMAAAAPPSAPGVARSANFEVYAQGGTADARAILLGFERLHAYFAKQTGLRLDKPSRVRVIAFRSRDDYAPYQLRPAADAYYVGSESGDTIVMTTPADGEIHVAAHEYAHFVLRANDLALPPWLNEGLSECFSTVRLNARGVRSRHDPPARLRVLQNRAWMALGELVLLPADSPLREQRDTVDLFYAESWALADMLTVAPEYRLRFPELIAALSSGAPSDQALARTYGKSLDEITGDLRAWVDKRRVTQVALPELAPGTVDAEISEIPSLAWRGVLAGLLLATNKFDQAEAAYQELARAVPKNADYPASLAEISLHKHDWKDARQYWQRALDLRIADADVCYRYALLADSAGLPAADYRPALERAVAVRPDFDNAYYLLAHLDNNAGRYESAVTHLRAMRTVSADRQFSYWAALSYALDELGRHEEAKAAAIEARDHAATDEERARALQLAEIADTDVNVRFTRDAEGNARLITTRVPREEQNWNPFIEPGDRIRRIEGKLQAVNCDGTSASLVVETSGGAVTLSIPDTSRVQIRNASGEFTCGPQPGNAVIVVYAAREREEGGIVRGVEFP